MTMRTARFALLNLLAASTIALRPLSQVQLRHGKAAPRCTRRRTMPLFAGVQDENSQASSHTSAKNGMMPVFAGVNGENSHEPSATGAKNGMIMSESSGMIVSESLTTGVSLLTVNGVEPVHISVHQQSSAEAHDAELSVGVPSDSAVNGNSKVLVDGNIYVVSNDESPSSPLISLPELEGATIVGRSEASVCNL
jgi:hypothetical protein